MRLMPAAPRVMFDTSLVGAYLFPEADSSLAQAAFRTFFEHRCLACVPSLFWAELQQLCHLKRQRDPSLDVNVHYSYALSLGLLELPEDVFSAAFRSQVWYWMGRLRLGPSDDYFVGSYDCYYLSVALQLGVCLWTLDRNFRDRAHTDPALIPVVLQVGRDVQP